MNRRFRLLCALLIWFFSVPAVLAVPIEVLEPGREWRVGKIEITGNEHFSDSQLYTEMLTQSRPWYRPWETRPVFDPITFKTDLERLGRFYESHGYYKQSISYDLELDNDRGIVNHKINIKENSPVIIADVDVEIAMAVQDQAPPALPQKLPATEGEIFDERKYQQTEQILRGLFLENGFAHVETQRSAEVNVDLNQAFIRYSIRSGPKAVFAETTIKGTDKVDPQLIRDELAYEPGEMFSLQKIRDSRRQILALDLFSALRLSPTRNPADPTIVPMEVQVTEKPPREVSIGAGYSTEEEFRASLDWRHLNWFGGGRRLTLTARYSSIVATGLLELVQPHFLDRRSQGVLTVRHDQEDEETYTRNATRFGGRYEHRFSTALTGFFGYRFEFDKLNKVNAATIAALGEIKREGFLSGPSAGLIWNDTDDPLYPTLGEVLSLTIDQGGAFWGGQYGFYRITGEAKKYFSLGWETILASRLRLGVADAIGGQKNFPLFERFFAGGQNSVRGYERRHLGPLSTAGDPLGGLSLMEGSVELRRPIWQALGGALFLDFGQVSLRRYDIPVDDLKFSTGFGLSYTTPVGPVRLDIGFPFNPPRGDRPWQVHFSIGAFF